MGDPNDENAPKSDTTPDDKNSDQYLGSIRNKIYTSLEGFSLVFQDGSPY